MYDDNDLDGKPRESVFERVAERVLLEAGHVSFWAGLGTLYILYCVMCAFPPPF